MVRKLTKSFVLSEKCVERMETLIETLGISRSVLIEKAILQFDAANSDDTRTKSETLAELKLEAIKKVLNGDGTKFVSDATDAYKVTLIKQLFAGDDEND